MLPEERSPSALRNIDYVQLTMNIQIKMLLKIKNVHVCGVSFNIFFHSNDFPFLGFLVYLIAYLTETGSCCVSLAGLELMCS